MGGAVRFTHEEPCPRRPWDLRDIGDVALVTADDLVTGDLVTRQLSIQLQPSGWPHPALLGMDVLGSHRCDFHFDRQRVELDRLQPTDAAWFPFLTGPHSTPTVEVHWGHTKSSAAWDTGAGVTLVDQTWARRHPELVVIGRETGRGTT